MKKNCTLPLCLLCALIALTICWPAAALRAADPPSFAPTVNYVVGGTPRSITTGDFNKDGYADLATTIHHSQVDNGLEILLNNGNGTFAMPVRHLVGMMPYFVTTGDFNKDGYTDLVTLNYSLVNNDLSVLLNNNGDGTFVVVHYDLPNISPFIAFSKSVISGDFNNDGYPDLATANDAQHVADGAPFNFSILLNNGNGTFAAGVVYDDLLLGNPISITTGDFNKDGNPDLAMANFTGCDVSILQGNGDGTFAAAVNYDVECYPISIAMGDFNNDGNPDLATGDLNFAKVSVLLGKEPAGTFMAAVDYPVGADNPKSVTTGDFNADGKIDLATANEESSLVSILLGKEPAGTFMAAVDYLVGVMPVSITSGDFNADGKTDLATANSGSNFISVLLAFVLTANAGPDLMADEGSLVTLDGSASTCQPGESLMYEWSQVGGTPVVLLNPASPTPSFIAPQVGQYGEDLVFRLRVKDSMYESVYDMVTITVLDTNRPPVCALAAPTMGLLWPPAHKMIEVGIGGVSDLENAQVLITVNSVTQDEPVNGLGNENTSPDAVLLGGKVLLRQERSGRGNGRVYRIFFTAADGQGGSCDGNVTVCVPKDAKAKTCVDDGISFDSTIP